MSEPFSWNCPFCNRDTTITTGYCSYNLCDLIVPNADGDRRLIAVFIVCPNPTCRKFTLTVTLFELRSVPGLGQQTGKPLQIWKLIPPAHVKVFPDYIPKAIVDDYSDACRIVDLSPKASATSARRCLQGLIRDFWGVQEANLAAAIDAIQGKVSQITWEAIHAVRSLGNIGAHMERDINLIIDVDPEEARKLIWLIEYLIEDCYIRQHEQQERLKEITLIANAKQAQRKQEIPNANMDQITKTLNA